MAHQDDDRTRLARAYHRATQVATIAIGMVIPPVAGRYADVKLGSRVVFTILGAAFGLAYGIWHLMKLTDPPSRPGAADSDHRVDSNAGNETGDRQRDR